MNKIGEKHNDLTIIAKSTKGAHGYLYHYWVKCSCGNIKRYRYDQIRRKENCGQCEDFNNANVLRGYIKELGDGKE